MDSADRYRDAVVHALAGFQLIEESLKGYIEFYHESVRRFLPEEMAYDYSRRDVQDAALGKLVNVFAKVSTNSQLVGEIRSLQHTRDELAHTALIELFGNEQPASEFDRRASELVELGNRLSSVLSQVNKASLDLLLLAELKGRPKAKAK